MEGVGGALAYGALLQQEVDSDFLQRRAMQEWTLRDVGAEV